VPVISAQETEEVLHLNGEGELLVKGNGSLVIKGSGYLVVSEEDNLRLITGTAKKLLTYKGFNVYDFDGVGYILNEELLVMFKGTAEVYSKGSDFSHFTGQGYWEVL
jgi:hypothetical protein